jgi:hypothetical protein
VCGYPFLILGVLCCIGFGVAIPAAVLDRGLLGFVLLSWGSGVIMSAFADMTIITLNLFICTRDRADDFNEHYLEYDMSEDRRPVSASYIPPSSGLLVDALNYADTQLANAVNTTAALTQQQLTSVVEVTTAKAKATLGQWAAPFTRA